VSPPRELAILNAVAAALNSSTDVRQALEQTLALVADLLGLHTGWVWLLDQETHHFYSAAVREMPPYAWPGGGAAGASTSFAVASWRLGTLM
jgi:GAF domain-containing protein